MTFGAVIMPHEMLFILFRKIEVENTNIEKNN